MAQQKSSAARTKRKNRKSAKQIVRRRIQLLVAAIVIIAALIIGIVCAVTGVFDKKASVSTLTIKDTDEIVCEEVTSFEENYYKKSDLKTYAKEEISKFNKENKANVKLEKVSTKKDTAYVKTQFTSAEEYQTFTGYEMFTGSILDAQAAGYDFNATFVSVKDGKKGDAAKVDDVLAKDDYKVAIVKENITVNVDGTICYVSDECTTVNDKSSITITPADGNEDAASLVYIIYK